MKTILITSQKGGSGKTMLAAHLSVEAERKGDPAWLIDTDRQATLTRWHERRQRDTPRLGEIRFEKLGMGLDRLRESGAAYCFIDTSPTISNQTSSLLRFADLVLIPVRPSPCDLWAVIETVFLVKNADRPFRFIVTHAKPQALITAQAIAALSEHGRVGQTFISDRVAYAAAMTGGSTAPELMPKGTAAREIEGVWAEVKTCFIEKVKVERTKAYG